MKTTRLRKLTFTINIKATKSHIYFDEKKISKIISSGIEKLT